MRAVVPAIRHAVLHGSLDGLRLALETLPPDRAGVWAGRIDEAEAWPPDRFDHNGWVVQALQAAWSAIVRTPVPVEAPADGVFAAQHLQRALEAAIRGGNDTDTVAAIAGGLLDAVWGASAIPPGWQRRIHGWPGLRARDLIRLGVLIARGGRPDGQGWPASSVLDYTGFGGTGARARHPHDPGVWLIDRADPSANAHLDYVMGQAAQAVADLRAEGRTVLLHCVQAQSRTPAVAALYAARHLGMSAAAALADVTATLPAADPNRAFRAALHRLAP